MRITRDEMLLGVADLVSRRGTCRRLQVGAVISVDGRILSCGYNGAPRGLDHCSDLHCQLDRPCTWATHAEMNALIFAARAGIATNGATMHATDSPCESCAKAIIAAGIQSVVFSRMYRVTIGLGLLNDAGVEWKHVTV